MEKGQPNQRVELFAFHATTAAGGTIGYGATAQAGNITMKIHQDHSTAGASTTTANPLELDSGEGYYVHPISSAECNVTSIDFIPSCSTTGIKVRAIPPTLDLRPPNFDEFGIESDGDLTKVNTLDGHTVQTGDSYAQLPTNFSEFSISTAGNANTDVKMISGDLDAADNLEATYDGTGYTNAVAPATQGQMDSVSNVGAATAEQTINEPGGFILTTGTNEVGDEDNTQSSGPIHSFDDDSGTVDGRYLFNIGGAFTPTSLAFIGRVNGNNDDVDIFVNTGTIASPVWVSRGTIEGQINSVNNTHTFKLFIGDIMTGADAGKVQIRFYATGLSSATVSTDQIFVEKTANFDSTGYAKGALWYDDGAANTNAVADVDGTVRNKVSSWAAIRTLMGLTGIDTVEIANGSTVTLDASAANFTLLGSGWYLALGSQAITAAHIEGAVVTGIASGDGAKFFNCKIGTVTMPPAGFNTCGFGYASGTFTAASDGQFIFADCFSLVPGSGSPSFDFSGTGATTGINNRRWAGGSVFTLDSDCTLSHEVLVGGGTTITVGGADVEIRGLTRSITLTTVAATSTVQIIANTGDIAINGTGGAVNIWGTHSDIIDNSGASVTINDEGLDTAQVTTDVAAILVDTSATLPTAAENADAVWDEVLTGAIHNDPTSAGRRLRELASTVIITGTSPNTSGTTNTSTLIELDTDASATAGAYDPAVIGIVAGTGAGQSRQIFEYSGATRLAYVNRDWKIIPDNTSEYIITSDSGDTHVNEGVAAGGASGSITLNALASAVNDMYNNQLVFIVAGTGADQARLITDYVGGTQVATVEPNWNVNPDSTSIYAILPTAIYSPAEISALVTAAAPTAADIWTEASARTDDYGTLLEQLADFHFNDLDVVNADGDFTLRNKANSADLATWNIEDDDTNTTRTDVSWV